MPDAASTPEDLPSPGCCAGHDGHTHHVRDEYGGRGVYCCGHDATTLLIAYLKGSEDRYLDRPDVVQCTTAAELRQAARAHCVAVHATSLGVRSGTRTRGQALPAQPQDPA